MQASVKGYISLDGARVTKVEHETEPYAMQLTTPARRLSVLTPGVNPRPLKRPSVAASGKQMAGKTYDCPPSLDSKMNLLQKLDNWGKNALRNAMASGPIDAPFTAWTLAATSASELESWMGGFDGVVGVSTERAPLSAVGGNAFAAARAVEVM